jgi:hypothetical protein
MITSKIAKPASAANTSELLTNQRRNRIMATANLTAARLRELFNYNPDSGIFTRIQVPFNRPQDLGIVVGGLSKAGYWRICIDNIRYQAQRLAWLYVHGVQPIGDIDHINGVRHDNRISNLRDVSRSVNMQNLHRAHRDKAGKLLGVTYNSVERKWIAQICTNGMYKHLGRFPTEELAHSAYLSAKRVMHEGCTI